MLITESMRQCKCNYLYFKTLGKNYHISKMKNAAYGKVGEEKTALRECGAISTEVLVSVVG